MIARNIKDLSIALEALTRVPGSDILREQIDNLLVHEIDLKHKENNPLRRFDHPERPDDNKIPF